MEIVSGVQGQPQAHGKFVIKDPISKSEENQNICFLWYYSIKSACLVSIEKEQSSDGFKGDLECQQS